MAEECAPNERCLSNICRAEGYCDETIRCDTGLSMSPNAGNLTCDLAINECKPCTSGEPSSSFEAPLQIDPSGYSTSLNTECPDFFGFELSPSKTLNVTVTFVNDDGDIDVKLYDSEGTQVETSAAQDVEEISFQPMAAGRFVLKVYGFQGANVPISCK